MELSRVSASSLCEIMILQDVSIFFAGVLGELLQISYTFSAILLVTVQCQWNKNSDLFVLTSVDLPYAALSFSGFLGSCLISFKLSWRRSWVDDLSIAEMPVKWEILTQSGIVKRCWMLILRKMIHNCDGHNTIVQWCNNFPTFAYFL